MEQPLTVPGHHVDDWRDRLPTRAGAAPYERRSLAAITHAVVHYSAVDADSSAQQIAAYQVGKPDGDLFPAIAYHFVVRQSGEIEQCHDLAVRAWHAGSYANDVGIAICLPMLHGPTPRQAAACARLIGALGERLGRALAVVGHKELQPSRCPGDAWLDWKSAVSPPSPPARELSVDGVPVKWAFYDAYCRLETLRPGLCGAPAGPHRLLGDGDAVQEFAGCTMLWSERRLWVAFK